jgi:RNA polymerase sigma-70 factor (ECF subfamily)
MDEHQERQVALGLREGRADAWRTLYEAYAGRVWSAVAHLLGSAAADIADVVQEAFLSAARSARTYDPQRGTLWFWLWGIARRHVALHFRQKERQERLEKIRARLAADGDWAGALESRQSPEESAARRELADLVRATLIELPAEYEMLLTAKYLQSEPVEEIARRERASEAAIRSKLARARQAFREAFGKSTAVAGDPRVGTQHDTAGR